MAKLGDAPPLTMDYLEEIRQKVRESKDPEMWALLGEIRRLQRMILKAAHYARTATAAGGSVHINSSLLEDLHRMCMMEPIVIKDLERKRLLLAPPRLPKDKMPIRAQNS